MNTKLIFGNEEGLSDIDICFVIPTYKRENLLNETLNSVFFQTKPYALKFCVKVISNDPNFNIDTIKKFLVFPQLLVYSNAENIGMVKNMNKCIELSCGKFTCFLQDDDLLTSDYFFEIEKIIKSNDIKNIDCLIPNRYFWNPNKICTIKSKLKNYFLTGNSIFRKKLKKINYNDSANVWYNIFMGGPTCGIIFKTNKLKESEGFLIQYPYIFDYVFFVNFSENNNVFLFNKYISIYRTSDSASLRPEVQFDFYKSNEFFLSKIGVTNRFVNRFIDQIRIFEYDIRSEECKKIIIENGFSIPNKTMKYYLFRIIRVLKLKYSGLYRRKNIDTSKLIKVVNIDGFK